MKRERNPLWVRRQPESVTNVFLADDTGVLTAGGAPARTLRYICTDPDCKGAYFDLTPFKTMEMDEGWGWEQEVAKRRRLDLFFLEHERCVRGKDYGNHR